MNFSTIARISSSWMGSANAFIISCGLVLIWAVSGPFLNFNTEWQLVINTTTTVLTFLMIFLLQNTQMRDTEALHKKIDNLIESIAEADNSLVGIEKEDN